MSALTEAEFLASIAGHQMQVMHDSGEFRHIRFGKPGTNCMHFNLTTVPGYLMITGDMGDWTFSRLRDMFEFFRAPERYGPGLHINLGYWSEKLVACECAGRFKSKGATEFDPKKFRAAIWRRALGLARDAKQCGADDEEVAELIDELKDVRDKADDGEQIACAAANDFEFTCTAGRYCLQDFFESDLSGYRHSFIWACYAIAWGIQQYDAAQPQQAAA